MGKVVNVQGGYDVVVAVNGRRWVFNPKCVVAAPGEVPPEVEDGKGNGTWVHWDRRDCPTYRGSLPHGVLNTEVFLVHVARVQIEPSVVCR